MSQLQDIQQEILKRFQRPRTTPGYAGGDLKDQLARDQAQGKGVGPVPLGGQILTPQNQAAITRPRSVFAPPQQVAQLAQQPVGQAANVFAPPQSTAPFGSSGQPFEASRPRRTQPRDYAVEDAATLRELEQKPRDWKDKTVDVVRALNSVWGNPKVFTPTRRERDIADTEQRVDRRLGEDRSRAQIAASEASAAAAQARPVFEQQRIDQGQQRIDQQKTTGQARIENWKTMRAEQRKARIVREYSSGMLNDPDALEYAADELEIPGTLRTKFINGELKNLVNEKGQIVTQNQNTGEIKSTGVTSYDTTKEAGRNRRAAEQIGAANTRAANAQAGANARAAGSGGRNGAPKSTAAANRLAAQYNQALANEIDYNKTRSSVATDNRTLDPAVKAQLQSRREVLWQQVMSTHPGMFESDEQGRLRPKATADRTTSRAWDPERFKTAFKKKKGRAPTQAEIESYQRAAQQ